MKASRYITSIIFFAFFVYFQSPLQASPDVAGFSFQKGAELYKADQTEAAILFFKDKESNQNLNRSSRLKAGRCVELLDYINFLEKQIKNYEIKNLGIKRRLLESKDDDTLLKRSIELIEIETSVEIRPRNLIEGEEFKKFLNELTGAKDSLLNRLALSKKQTARLKEFEKRTAQFETKSSDVADAPVAEMLNLREQARLKDKLIITQKKKMGQLQVDLAKVMEELESIRGDSVDVVARIETMTQELADKSLEIFEKDQKIVEMDQKIASLTKDYEDTQQRLSLVKKIIQEKDKALHEMEAYIDLVKLESEQQDDLSRVQFEKLKESFSLLEEKIAEQKELREQKLVALEKVLAEQEQKVASYQSAFESKDNKIRELSQELIQKSKELQDIKNVVRSKDRKLIEMDGFLQIYKGKLKDTTAVLKKRIRHVNVLQDRIGDLQGELDVSEDATRDLYEKILRLESQFSNLNQKTPR